MRSTNYKFLYRRYIPLVKLTLKVLIFCAVVYTANRALLSADYFTIKSYSHSGIVKFVNSQDFDNVVKSNVLGQNIFKFDVDAFEDTLKNSFLGIREVNVSKRSLTELNIQVQERVPMAVVIDKDQNKYLIDIDGYVLGLVEDSYFDLPTLNYESLLSVGQFIDKNTVPVAMEIINQSKVESVPVSSVSFKPEFSMFYVGDSTPVYMNNDANIKNSIKVVSKLLEQSALEGKKIVKIDLRYDKVIVLYN